MMDRERFGGFASGGAVTPLPEVLLEDAVPRMSDPAELAVTLYAVRLLQRVRRYPRLATVDALRSERALVETLASLCPERGVDAAFADGLEAAAGRGTLLRGEQHGAEGGPRTVVALNSADGRRAMAREAQACGFDATVGTAGPGARAAGVFQLYEDAIGPVPPALAEELAAAEAEVPGEWLAEAFNEAAARNARSWSYVRTILERWQREGRGDAAVDDRASAYEQLVRR